MLTNSYMVIIFEMFMSGGVYYLKCAWFNKRIYPMITHSSYQLQGILSPLHNIQAQYSSCTQTPLFSSKSPHVDHVLIGNWKDMVFHILFATGKRK